MYDPFRTARSKARKKKRRSPAVGLANPFAMMATASKPAKRKAAKTKPRTVTGRGGKPGKTPGNADTPMTSRAKILPPRGASFRNHTRICDFGRCVYKLYIPAMAHTAQEPLPLLVMLHGCGQTPEDFARGTGMNALAEEFGFLVAYPGQERKAHLRRCWNWFRPGDQYRDAGEPALIASVVRHIIDGQGIDPTRVYIAGLSAGASLAVIVATAYPDIFAAVGAHSGLPVGAAHNAASAVLAMRHGAPGRSLSVEMPTIVFHGDADTVVGARNGLSIAARALEPFGPLRKTEKVGHGAGGKRYLRTTHRRGQGRPLVVHWAVGGIGHAWSGGNTAGRFTDPCGPDASREMVRFFLRHRAPRNR